jgi:hypothetical protein
MVVTNKIKMCVTTSERSMYYCTCIAPVQTVQIFYQEQRGEDAPCSVVSLVRGSIYIQSMFRLFRTAASVRKMSLFSCISSERSDVHSVNVQDVQNSCQREEDVPVQLYSSERSDVHSVNFQVVQNSCQREEDVPVQLSH